MTVKLIIALLLIWMLFCGYAGFRRSPGLFAVVAGLGIAANTVWMVVGLDADPLSRHALMAHLSAVIYVTCAFTFGWLIRRMVEVWRKSRVETR